MTKAYKELGKQPGETTSTKWDKPTAMPAIDAVFSTKALSMMPTMAEIPKEFKNQDNKWTQFQRDWFFRGIKNIKATPKPGIDKQMAMRHLTSIQSSWDPDHGHKEAAVAYLASLWFEEIAYEVSERK